MRIANKSVSKVCQNNITNRPKAAHFGIKQQQKKALDIYQKSRKTFGKSGACNWCTRRGSNSQPSDP